MDGRTSSRAPFLLVVVLLPMAASWGQQDAASPKFTLFGGAGVATSSIRSQGALQFGASFDGAPPNKFGGFLMEGGYVGPTAQFTAGSAVFSVNYMAAWQSQKAPRVSPFATAGYSRLFGTGNALNFGAGLDYRFNPQGYKRAFRMEVRDYLIFTTPKEHNLALRVGLVFYIPD